MQIISAHGAPFTLFQPVGGAGKAPSGDKIKTVTGCPEVIRPCKKPGRHRKRPGFTLNLHVICCVPDYSEQACSQAGSPPPASASSWEALHTAKSYRPEQTGDFSCLSFLRYFMINAMKTKLYLDTSIPSAHFDFSKPARQLMTQQWFTHEAQKYSLYISVLTIQEIDQFKNIPKRDNIRQLLLDHSAKVLNLGEEATKIAREYLNKGAIPKSEPEDALHIAIATVNNMDALASWNFKHIVSMAPIKKIHEINRKLNYDIIEIGSLEMFGGSKYGNL